MPHPYPPKTTTTTALSAAAAAAAAPVATNRSDHVSLANTRSELELELELGGYSGFDHLDHSSLIGDSIDLEHYISAMEARRHDQEPDVWAQLQQKESDILLAAELGKALLEKNEELVKQQEKLIEDYSSKIEVSHGTHIKLTGGIVIINGKQLKWKSVIWGKVKLVRIRRNLGNGHIARNAL